MGCVFCASGLKGVERNLSVDEILEQVFHLRNLLPPEETVTQSSSWGWARAWRTSTT